MNETTKLTNLYAQMAGSYQATIANDSKTLAIVYDQGTSYDTLQAAKLLAAAPELLESLQALLEWTENTHGIGCAPNDLKILRRAAYSAIQATND